MGTMIYRCASTGFARPILGPSIFTSSYFQYNFLSNSVKYKNKSKIHVYYSLCMEFEINSTVKDNNLVGVKL